MKGRETMADFCRRSKTEMLADLDCEPTKARMVGHSTLEYTRPDGVRVIRYQRTDIVLIEPNGTLQLFTDGWRTQNTLKRINDYLPDGMFVWQDKGIWWISYRRCPSFKAIRFVEGIKIGPRGGIRTPKAVWRVVPPKFKVKRRWRSVVRTEASKQSVVCTLDNGEELSFPAKDARIGPDLRMHAKVQFEDPTFEQWQDSDFFTS
jgi:hypothetical protein